MLDWLDDDDVNATKLCALIMFSAVSRGNCPDFNIGIYLF